MLPQNFHNQSNFDDVVDDDCVRGELDSDLFIPDGPVRHPVVQQWAARAQPRLCQTVHDTVLTALAAYFPYDGGWVYLTQEMIAKSERIAALEKRLTEFSGEWEDNGNDQPKRLG